MLWYRTFAETGSVMKKHAGGRRRNPEREEAISEVMTRSPTKTFMQITPLMLQRTWAELHHRYHNKMMQDYWLSELRKRSFHKDPADRFIPQRFCLEQAMLKLKLESEKTDSTQSVLEQDISQHYVNDYLRHLEGVFSIKRDHGRLFWFSQQPLPKPNTNHEVYQWPVRSRKRPLIKVPHAVLDLPNFRASFCMNSDTHDVPALNLLDWGSSRRLAAALDRSVYLNAIGEHPEELNKLMHGYWSSIWNTETKKLEKEIICHCFEHGGCVINALDWHPGGTLYASGCSNGTLQVHHHLPGYRSLCLDFAHEGEITSLKSSPDGRFLASAGEDGAVRAMAWHPWKTSFLVIGGGSDGTLIMCNVNKCSKESHLLDPRASICAVEFSPLTGELVVAICTAIVGSDETLRIWYFLGPSSANATDISRYLKPLMPSHFVIPTIDQMRNNRIKINNFGCCIR
ncbi:hypothetical protein C0J52_03008 [Blattella germanica]|nr:hypothetical protein C0J52_03008 [Blattella germanica]